MKSTELTLMRVLIPCLLIIYCRYLYESHLSQSPINFVIADNDVVADEIDQSQLKDESPQIDEGK